jgi:hypothetical protein
MVFHNAIRHRMREKDDYDRLYSIISEAIDGRDQRCTGHGETRGFPCNLTGRGGWGYVF